MELRGSLQALGIHTYRKTPSKQLWICLMCNFVKKYHLSCKVIYIIMCSMYCFRPDSKINSYIFSLYHFGYKGNDLKYIFTYTCHQGSVLK